MQGGVLEAGLTDDQKIDSTLMNFAYLVEHFYAETDNTNALKKFGKYLSRIYYGTKCEGTKLKFKCWSEKIDNYNLDVASQDLSNTKVALDKLRKKLSKAPSEVSATKILINNLYNCVKDHALSLAATK